MGVFLKAGASGFVQNKRSAADGEICRLCSGLTHREGQQRGEVPIRLRKGDDHSVLRSAAVFHHGTELRKVSGIFQRLSKGCVDIFRGDRCAVREANILTHGDNTEITAFLIGNAFRKLRMGTILFIQPVEGLIQQRRNAGINACRRERIVIAAVKHRKTKNGLFLNA